MHPIAKHISNYIQNNFEDNSNYCVALSGGIDSIVLLHILAQLRLHHNLNLTAIHINHGISPNAVLWQDFCANICLKWDIPFSFKQYTITKDGGDSLENNARQSRYKALFEHDSDIIALAHHQQDQIETVLSQILRGSNIHNFASMQELTHKQNKYLWRPLLSIQKSQIIEYSTEYKLDFVNDESNSNTKYLRNFLRHDIIPLLLQQDKYIANKLIKTINELQNSASLIDELAVIDLNTCANTDNKSIGVMQFKELSTARQINLLSYFLRINNHSLPSEKQLIEFANQACSSRWDKTPSITINNAYHLIKTKSTICIKFHT